MDSKLAQLTKVECFEYAKIMLDNSKQKWKSSILLYENNDYAGAINLQIISTEELVKGFIMYLDSMGFEFRKLSEIDSIMRKSHKMRHYIGFIMFLFNLLVEELKYFLLKVKNNPELLNIEKLKSPQFEKQLGLYGLRKMVIIKNEFDWFAKVELFRQKSAHVDYTPKLNSPIDFELNDYEGISIRLNIVQKMIFDFMDMFSTEDSFILKEIIKLKKQFVDEQWYVKLNSSIQSTKGGKKSPFQLTKEFLKQIA